MTGLEKGLSVALIASLTTMAYLGHKTDVAAVRRDLAAESSAASSFSADASSQSAYASLVVELQKQDAAAYVSETRALSHLITSLQTAKEDINASPDAAKPYYYSNGLYDLMRNRTEASAESGADAPASAGVDTSGL